ncbi:hypothetical protein Tco_0557236 [Tanacetum coccineum]
MNKTTKIATMQVTRNNRPLNYKIFNDFNLKMLWFTEWLELHSLASKRKNATNYQLLKNLKAMFKSVATTASKLGQPPPPQLTDFELPPFERKRKRRTEFVKEMFILEDIEVDGMHMNLTLPQEITGGTAKQVFKEPEARILLYNGNFNLIFQRRSKYNLTSTPQLIRIQNMIKIDSPFAHEI